MNKLTTYLFFAGAILIVVGSFIGFSPVSYLTQFFSRNELSLDSLSEMRGMGGSILTIGLFIFAGAFVIRIENTALILSALIFGSFSAFRLLGILLDGMPSQNILIALTIEGAFALVAISLLLSQQSESLSVTKYVMQAK